MSKVGIKCFFSLNLYTLHYIVSFLGKLNSIKSEKSLHPYNMYNLINTHFKEHFIPQIPGIQQHDNLLKY